MSRMGFRVNQHNVIFNKTVTKLVTILTKCFFPYLNPTSYLNENNSGNEIRDWSYSKCL